MSSVDVATVYQIPVAVRCTPMEGDSFVAPIISIHSSGVFIETDLLGYPDRVQIAFFTQEVPLVEFEGEVTTAVRGRGVRVECGPDTPDTVLAALAEWSSGKPAMLWRTEADGVLDPEPEEEVVEAPDPKRRLEGMRVLVIDDDQGMLSLMRRLLTGHGATVTPVADPPTALEILYQRQTDAVLLDWMLPTIPGRDMFVEISASYPELPVAVVSGNLFWQGAMEDLRQLGVSTVLSKPIDMARLLQWLDDVLALTTRRPKAASPTYAPGRAAQADKTASSRPIAGSHA